VPETTDCDKNKSDAIMNENNGISFFANAAVGQIIFKGDGYAGAIG
jgi:hypothetical protein